MGYRSQVTLDNRLYYALMYIECDTFDLPQNGPMQIHLESGRMVNLQRHLLRYLTIFHQNPTEVSLKLQSRILVTVSGKELISSRLISSITSDFIDYEIKETDAFRRKPKLPLVYLTNREMLTCSLRSNSSVLRELTKSQNHSKSLSRLLEGIALRSVCCRSPPPGLRALSLIDILFSLLSLSLVLFFAQLFVRTFFRGR